MAKKTASRAFSTLAMAAASLVMAGCVNWSPVDDLKAATPTGSPFSVALFEDYAFLARSFGQVGAAGYTTFDQQGSISLASMDNDVANLANEYASKALALSRGEAVDPEPSLDLASHGLRDRLVRALTPGRDTYPRDAARAQADYDCWMLDKTVVSLAAAAQQCRRSLDVSLSRLESEVRATQDQTAASAAAPAGASNAGSTQSSDDSTQQ
ncbi:MAG: hypothetical protein KGL29_04460 [Alphaproteobacteria bacterium]|nr:hypothetical protein [Alphaproteobacteria bacterium]MDE2265128.1 hypothetical protein [Alphaproteobacteria bacterium]MDE2500524.1 hypothetical protein [Alphaproteobacteria bacterium]